MKTHCFHLNVETTEYDYNTQLYTWNRPNKMWCRVAWCVTLQANLLPPSPEKISQSENSKSNFTVVDLGAFATFRKTAVCQSAQNNSVPTGRINMKVYIWEFFAHSTREYKYYLNLTRVIGTSHEELCTFISRRIFVRMRKASHKCCRENESTHLIF